MVVRLETKVIELVQVLGRTLPESVWDDSSTTTASNSSTKPRSLDSDCLSSLEYIEKYVLFESNLERN